MSVNTAILLFKLRQVVNPYFLQSGGKAAVYLKLKEMTAEFENDGDFMRALAKQLDNSALNETVKKDVRKVLFEKEPYFRMALLNMPDNAPQKKELQAWAKRLFLMFKKEKDEKTTAEKGETATAEQQTLKQD